MTQPSSAAARAFDPQALAAWPAADRATLTGYMSHTAHPTGPATLGDPGWWVLTSGQARLLAEPARTLHAGDAFGAEALALGGGPDLNLTADGPIGLAHLSLARFEALTNDHPALALALLRATWPAPAAAPAAGVRGKVQLTLPDGEACVPAGTPIAAVLPATEAGRPVVAATLDRKVVALDTPVAGDAAISPLTDAHADGRAALRRSLGLVLLEAAHTIAPGLVLQFGTSSSHRQAVRVIGEPGLPLAELANRLASAMRAIVDEARPFRRESWSMEQAAMRFEAQGWREVVALLRTWRDASVTVVSCGHLSALAMGPFIPHTGLLGAFRLDAGGAGLELSLGDRAETMAPASQPEQRPAAAWLDVLGVRDLGGFNGACISGRVSQLIRAAEGFHEKRIGQIADHIQARGREVKVICIAGPSSSGKTTFIKRLTVQLQINGLNPLAISLDDYYCDREKTPVGLDGEYDYEALNALELPLLREHLAGLLAGHLVKTARYDFKLGKNTADGGTALRMGANDVIMLEGIHALNPRLLGDVVPRGQVVRLFVWPSTALPFDRLSHFRTTDLRLLRRIVRDRHTRGADAAANIMRWPSVRRGEERSILPFLPLAEEVFDSALIYEPAVLKVYAERYLLEVPQDHPAYTTAYRLRQLLDRFVAIYPDHVPPTSILREFIGGSGFEY